MRTKRLSVAVLAAALLLLCACAAAPAPAPAPSAEPTPAPKEFSRGYVDEDGAYINAFSGFGISLPDEWVLASDEELAEIMDMGQELLNDEQQFKTQIAKLTTIYDLMAGRRDGTANVVVMYENLALHIGGTAVTEAEYLDALTEELAALEALTYEIGDRYEAELADIGFDVLEVEAPDYGVSQSYYAARMGKYMLCIVFTNTAQPAIGDLADRFEAR